jgi:peroxiredoxin
MLNLKNGLLGAVVGGVTLLGLAAAPVMAQDSSAPAKHKESQPSKDEKKAEKQEKKAEKQEKKAEQAGKTAKVGEAAPAFELKDTDGKAVKLSDYKGKIVVLEWFNPACPAVKASYEAKTTQHAQDAFKGKDVVFLAINSGGPGKEGADAKDNVKARKDWNMTQPVLMDSDGKVGHAYGATNTPHVFVIDAKGNLAYAGAIDDGSFGKPGKTNYIETTVNALLKGESVTPSTTKAYGCSVKYGKQGA